MRQHNQNTRRSVVISAGLILTLVLVLVALFSRCARPGSSPFRIADGEMMGLVIRDPWYDYGTYPDASDEPNRAFQDRMGAMLEQMGVQWVRLEFQLDGGDLIADDQVARYDYFIQEVAPRHNLKILALLGFGLIRGQDPRILGMTTREVDPIYGAGIDNAKRIWLNRARMIVDHYQNKIAAYELFNEPNRVATAWNELVPAAEVARLHTTFYTFFHHIDRQAAGEQSWRDQAQIISGGLQPSGAGPVTEFGHLPDRYYLLQFYHAEAFTSYRDRYGYYPLDGLGYHPYPEEVYQSLPPTPTPTRTDADTSPGDGRAEPRKPDPKRELDLMQMRLDELRQILVEVGDPQQPFWITEIGHNAAFMQQNETTQAEVLRLIYTGLAERGDVAKIFWFKYEDFPPATGPDAQRWGTVIIPFVDGPCPGGACYDQSGRPERLRSSFWVYRELAGRGTALPEPPAQVRIRGPLGATVATDLRFTGVISRPTATAPFTYTWQAEEQETVIHTGAGHDTASFTWEQPGIYRIELEAANPGGVVVAAQTMRMYPEGTLRPRSLERR